MTNRIVILALLVTAACFGQTTHYRSDSDTVVQAWTTGGTTTSGAIGVNSLITCGTDGRCYTSTTNNWTETRTFKGEAPTIQSVRASAKLLDGEQIATPEYAALAKQLGVEGSADEASLLRVIYENQAKVYDFEKVDVYLARAALKRGVHQHWVWKALRTKDQTAISAVEFHGSSQTGLMDNVVYSHPVPERVLQRIKAIVAAVPDANFMVSDYEVIKPDPFLAVSTPTLLRAGKIWIIDQWDEPGFSDGPKVRDGQLLAAVAR